MVPPCSFCFYKKEDKKIFVACKHCKKTGEYDDYIKENYHGPKAIDYRRDVYPVRMADIGWVELLTLT